MNHDRADVAAPTGDPSWVPERFRAEAGFFVRAHERLVHALIEGGTLADLVLASGLPRKSVEQALAALEPDLEQRGDRYQLLAQVHEAYQRVFTLDVMSPDALRAEQGPDGAAAVLAEDVVREFISGLESSRPRPDRDLDHVAALPETAARRALWLDEQYDLAAGEVLCIGDHDLTSLAVARRNASARLTVVDVDDRILAFIDEVAQRLGWQIRCVWGDFRLGLPTSAQGTAALAFTDPPYTPEGVETFLVAALAGLGDRERGRVVMAYGYGEHQPALGLKVQHAAHELHLVFEAILPGFNRYRGAQAIGSRSDLYVCRPTARTWRALPALTARAGQRIYTHGLSSLESDTSAHPGPGLHEDALAGLIAAGSDTSSGHQLVLIGDGTRAWLSHREQIAGSPRAQWVSFASVIGEGLPRQLSGRDDIHAVVDLRRAPLSWLARILLGINASRLELLLDSDAAPMAHQLASLFADKYEIAVSPLGPDGGALLRADAVSARACASEVTRELLRKAHGRLSNTWPEALITRSRRAGVAMTKKEAAAQVAELVARPEVLRLKLIELPAHLLRQVVELSRGVVPD